MLTVVRNDEYAAKYMDWFERLWMVASEVTMEGIQAAIATPAPRRRWICVPAGLLVGLCSRGDRVPATSIEDLSEETKTEPAVTVGAWRCRPLPELVGESSRVQPRREERVLLKVPRAARDGHARRGASVSGGRFCVCVTPGAADRRYPLSLF